MRPYYSGAVRKPRKRIQEGRTADPKGGWDPAAWDQLSVGLSTGGSAGNKIFQDLFIWGKYRGGHLRRQPPHKHRQSKHSKGSAPCPGALVLLMADEEADD